MNSGPFHYSGENCSIARTLAIVGEKWTLVVMREAFYGVRRFGDFHRALGCPRNILSARLKRLVEENILREHDYQDPGSRARTEYRLTEKGLELYPVLIALMQWGDSWAADQAGPAVEVRHRHCGQSLSVELRCGAGHDSLTARDAYVLPGAGAKASSYQPPALAE